MEGVMEGIGANKEGIEVRREGWRLSVSDAYLEGVKREGRRKRRRERNHLQPHWIYILRVVIILDIQFFLMFCC